MKKFILGVLAAAAVAVLPIAAVASPASAGGCRSTQHRCMYS